MNYPIILGKNILYLTISNTVQSSMILPKYLETFEISYNSQLRLTLENPLRTIYLGHPNNWLIDNIPNKTLKIVSRTKMNGNMLKNNLPSDTSVVIERF